MKLPKQAEPIMRNVCINELKANKVTTLNEENRGVVLPSIIFGSEVGEACIKAGGNFWGCLILA